MDAFLAFLDHVHSMLTTTYHNTPIMLMASPRWTRPDCETIARYIFEKTRTPALCLIHSGVATQYGLKWPHMTVVDVGFAKVDVTCIYDSRVVNHVDLGVPLGDGPGGGGVSGGEAFTQRLLKLLKDEGFTYDMAEQLKKSHICEVLPYVPDNPQLMELPHESSSAVPPPSAALLTASEGPRVVEPGHPAAAFDGDEEGNGASAELDDGVLDVASIVTSGQTKEFLAKKEKEKAEKAKGGRRGKDKEADAVAARPVRLPNTKRLRNVFHYEEYVQQDKTRPKENGTKAPEAAPEAAPEQAPVQPAEALNGAAPPVVAGEGNPVAGEPAEAPKEDGEVAGSGAPEPEPGMSFFPSADESQAAAAPAPAPEPERQVKRQRREVEVGLERFTFADRAEIDRIVTAVYRAVQGIEDMYMRPSCWENLVFVGNGCRLKGLKENILQTLNARHLISPSSATMFTSELPSNLATPSGTGSQTPTGNFTNPPHQLPTSSSVNPLLQAATTASLALPPASVGGGGAGGAGGVPGAPGSNAGDPAPSHHFHSQTPTAIKLATLPTYLGEWTKNGFEEAMFLGAQVAARLAFCVHNMDAQGLESQRLMSLSRVDYK